MILDLMPAAPDFDTTRHLLEYALREALSPGLEGFVGGATVIVEGSALLVILLILIIL